MYFQLVAVLLQLREVHAFGNDLHEFVEQMHDFRPLALQPLDDLHARDQTLLAGFEILNIGDLRVELDDLLLEEIVLLDLSVGPARVHEFADDDQNDRGEHRGAGRDQEFSTAYFTFLLTPGK